MESLSWRGREELQISTSLGVAYYPEDGTSAEQLLATADRRMYRDKANYYKTTEAGTLSAGEAASVITA